MDLCRICLNSDPTMDILDIQTTNFNDTKSFVGVVLFCLDIKVIKDTKVTTKICEECYEKTIMFNKFKLLALKNDFHLKTISNNVILNEDKDIHVKLEEFSVTSDDNCDGNGDQLMHDVKDELNSNDDLVNDHSDEELLCVFAKIKTESVEENNERNGKEIRKRGRPKKLKTDLTVAKELKRKRDRPKSLKSDITNLKEVKRKRGRPIKLKTDVEMKMCETCGKTFKNLKAHLEVHKPKDALTLVSCTACDKTFRTKINRNKHFKRKHLGIKKQCTICKKKVSCLRSHHLSVHDKESMPFQCVSCGLRFLSQSKLSEHMNYHTKDRPFQCDVCEKRFRLKLTLVTHVRSVHNNEKPHLCQFCSKSFYKKYHLQIHLRTHTKEKPYECKECGKFYTSSSTLKNHMLIHSDVKTFGCDLCDMTFVKHSYLKTHMISHLKEKRYACQFCDAKFHRSDHRKRHEWTAHQRHLAVGD